MGKKITIILVFSLLTSGLVFADEEVDNGGSGFPRHTITIDPFMTLGSLFIWTILADTDLKGEIFLTALQYEFQLTENISLAARFGMKRLGLYDSVLSSTAAEGHFRLYPGEAKVFFLDAMLGYTNFQMTSMPTSNLFAFGFKIGWRNDYGKPGGFIFEPSFGYTGVVGKINMGRNFSNNSEQDYYDDSSSGMSDDSFNFLVKQYFIGGFTFNLMMGYRF
jgi:hypothetical protein